MKITSTTFIIKIYIKHGNIWNKYDRGKWLICFKITMKKNRWDLPRTLLLQSFISSVQSLSSVQLFVTPWNAACQASLSITYSQSLLKLMSIKSVMPSNHLILCGPLFLLPSIFPSIRVFSNESVLCIRWPK